MNRGRTGLYDFERDDGTVVVVEYKRDPYYPATGPTWDCGGQPAEGGGISEWDCHVTLTADEFERLEAELEKLPWSPGEDDDGPEDWREND